MIVYCKQRQLKIQVKNLVHNLNFLYDDERTERVCLVKNTNELNICTL